MSVQSFKNAGLWIDGFKFDGQIRATRLEFGAEPLDATTISDNSRVRAGGLHNITFTHEGYFAATASSSGIDAVVFDAVGGSSKVTTVAPQNSSEGAVAYMFTSLHTEYSPRAQVGELLGYGVSASADSDLTRGLLLRNTTALDAASVTGTAFQLTNSSSGKTVIGHLHVLASDTNGAGSTEQLVMTIQSDNSSTFPSPTTVLTFTGTTEGSTGEYKSAAASTDDWFRALATSPTSSGEFYVVVSVGMSSN